MVPLIKKTAEIAVNVTTKWLYFGYTVNFDVCTVKIRYTIFLTVYKANNEGTK